MAQNNSYFIPQNSHLLFSVFAVTLAALMYGVAPASVVPEVFDIRVETTDLANVFRAVMCLYLAITGVWVFGIVKAELWRVATLSNILFLGSITLGRMLSWIFDGAPSAMLVSALFVEFLMTAFGVFQYFRYKDEY